MAVKRLYTYTCVMAAIRWHGRRLLACAGALVCTGLLAVPASANPQSEALRRQAFVHAYSLDHDEAVATALRAVEADPDDPGAHRTVAAILWLNLLYQRGSVTVDDYMGSISQPNAKLKSPPPELAAAFRSHIERALQLAERQLRLRPNDAAAHYDVGAAVGRMAAWSASVEGKTFGAFTAARRAFDEHERAIELDPSRRDADLVLGTYRYIVANLSRVMRWAAYIIGFGGGRERAIQQLESCAAYRSDVQVEAKFALVLIYSRERRHDDVLRLLRSLREEFPKNRLLWLESGSSELRAGRPSEALPLLTTGVGMFEHDNRPKSFGEGALWYFKRGAALVATNDGPKAEADLRRALDLEARDWVRGRVHCELGKLADLNGDRKRAKQEYQQARWLAERDNDPHGLAEAERLIDRPYKLADPKGTNSPPARQ